MASISRQPNGFKTIQFVDADRIRRSIRLGKCNQRQAEKVKIHVEHLLAAKISQCPLDNETSKWVACLDGKLYDRLATVGLVSSRKRRGDATLENFIDDYITMRSDVKPRTKDIFQRTRDSLVRFFGANKSLVDITGGDATEWRLWLSKEGRHNGKSLATNTVNDRCKKAKQFFAFAVDSELISRNPFAKLKGSVGSNPDRQYFVSMETISKVIDSCPDSQWRLIVALSRYGGLRCPSEHLTLRWEDVLWSENKLVVHSPKTEHHDGGESRILPLFPQLRKPLEEVFELAEPGTEYVITRYRSTNSNLRTQLLRICKRAGVRPWPRLFSNLRSSRQTELAETFPSHVVCQWLGNSEIVARKHYLQVTDDHFEKAVQFPVQYDAALRRKLSQVNSNANEKTPVLQHNATACGTLPVNDYTRRDSNPQPSVPKVKGYINPSENRFAETPM